MLDTSHSLTETETYRRDRNNKRSQNITETPTIDFNLEIGPYQFSIFDAPKALRARIVDIASAIDRLSMLEPGWDTYKAKAISNESLAYSFKTAFDALIKFDLDPSIFPLSSGGVCLSWRRGDREAELEIRERANLLLVDGPEERPYEAISLIKAKGLLFAWLGQMLDGDG